MGNIKFEDRAQVYQAAIDLWGPDHQVGVAAEEMAELTQALSKLRRYGPRPDLLAGAAEEVADVLNMVEQLRMIYQIDALVELNRPAKVEKLAGEIAAEKARRAAVKPRVIEIKASCCGDCPYYNMKRHCCGLGARDEGKAQDPFYADCPLNWRADHGNQP